MLAYSVVALQFILFGYSLCFSEQATSRFIGDFKFAGLDSVGLESLPLTAPAIPAIVFAIFQMQFSTITAALIFGSVVERIRLLPCLVFAFVWATIVYDPIVYWIWGARGWLKTLGVLDFAGGGPIEICSGASGLALSLIVGQRRKRSSAHNLVNVNIATGLLWFGWFGFNAGSALGANPRAAMAAMNTILAPAAGSLAWVLYDYARSKKITSLGYCSGCLAGLVAITPGCGFVAPWAAVVIGTTGGLLSNFLCYIKTYVGYDDSMDVFGIHGGVGFVGLILTGVFASSWVINLDGTVLAGGAIEGNWSLVGYQTLAAVVCFAWAFFVTLLLAFLFSKVSFLSLRSTDGDECDGMDQTMMGEVAYQFVPSSPGFVELSKPKKTPSVHEVDLEKVDTIIDCVAPSTSS